MPAARKGTKGAALAGWLRLSPAERHAISERRIEGSHRIDGGGDRVRLSRELERDCIEAGLVQDWQRTNAKRSADRKVYRKRPLTRRAPEQSGQPFLFPELEKPVNRLHQFGGGSVPRAVSVETEFRRQQLGLSQYELAAMIGVSQGQYANAMRGHDPISARATNRLRDTLLSRGRDETPDSPH